MKRKIIATALVFLFVISCIIFFPKSYDIGTRGKQCFGYDYSPPADVPVNLCFGILHNKEVKRGDGNCPVGYNSTFVFPGGGPSYYLPCVKNAPDTGKVCDENSQCSTKICEPLQIFAEKCKEGGTCEGVTGVCVSNHNGLTSIPKKNTILRQYHK
jgi:hypothetical protein